MGSILIIDDNETFCTALGSLLRRMNHVVHCARDMHAGLGAALHTYFDAVFLDVQLPDGNGLDAIPRLRSKASRPEVIVMTGMGGVDDAERATRLGAWSYVVKGISYKPLLESLASALDYRSESRLTPTKLALKAEGVVGSSPQLCACLEALAQAAATDTGVLLTGETGTGKELFARAIHKNSARQGGEFVVVDCSALPEPLVESLLFGHAKGTFTGAEKDRAGLIRQAHGGTLFLDEVGELPLAAQTSFLRVLQERRYRPVGSDVEVESDFRLVAATNRDLEAMVHAGTFRDDLLYRLRAFSVHLPPLRERLTDLQEIVMYRVAITCARFGINTKRVSPAYLEALSHHDWPGNVRELIQAIEASITAARNHETLYPSHLPERIRIAAIREETAVSLGEIPPQPTGGFTVLPPLRDVREAAADEAERVYLSNLMRVVNGSVQEACRISGLSRSRLYTLLRKYGLTAKSLN